MKALIERIALLIVLRLLKRLTAGQGFAHLDVTYDSAIGYECYRLWISHERDGEIGERLSEDPQEVWTWIAALEE